jgi:ubiquinone/menaquinone biosynthesis C-methylase UbiE
MQSLRAPHLCGNSPWFRPIACEKDGWKNVTVVREDATAMSFSDAAFDGAISFTMMHHVPSVALQDRLLAEVARVLRPGGTFAGVDSLPERGFHMLHLFDTRVPVDPASLPKRLQAAGFVDVQVDVNPYASRFRAAVEHLGKFRVGNVTIFHFLSLTWREDRYVGLGDCIHYGGGAGGSDGPR